MWKIRLRVSKNPWLSHQMKFRKNYYNMQIKFSYKTSCTLTKINIQNCSNIKSTSLTNLRTLMRLEKYCNSICRRLPNKITRLNFMRHLTENTIMSIIIIPKKNWKLNYQILSTKTHYYSLIHILNVEILILPISCKITSITY